MSLLQNLDQTNEGTRRYESNRGAAPGSIQSSCTQRVELCIGIPLVQRKISSFDAISYNLHLHPCHRSSVSLVGTVSMKCDFATSNRSCGADQKAGLIMSVKPARLNSTEVKTGQLSLKRILSVQCPVCRAKPKEQCTFTTGHPSLKTHLKRAVAASKVSHSESGGEAALRSLRGFATSSFRALFRPK